MANVHAAGGPNDGDMYTDPNRRDYSPTSSVGTSCPQDETSSSDDELDEDDFERKVEERIGLRRQPSEEADAEEMARLFEHRPEPGSPEETALYNRVMISLRKRVQALEDNEIFEQMVLKGSQVQQQQQPMSSEIDVLMRNMMSSKAFTSESPKKSGMTNGPWNNYGTPLTGSGSVLDGNVSTRKDDTER